MLLYVTTKEVNTALPTYILSNKSKCFKDQNNITCLDEITAKKPPTCCQKHIKFSKQPLS